jgi:3-hydroxyisobutyrate dehydrogenase-like beta-hydroxyacid dehydrogenase
MSDKPVVGFVGVGLMGWGMAKNAVEKGFPLRVVAHRKREAVDDLVARGARECGSLAEMAAEAEIVVLCVTGSPEVTAVTAALAEAARPGLTIVDTSTSEPEVTERLAAELAERGIVLVDAPLSRTPQHTWDGEATTFVGGPPEVFERIRPLLETWASAVIPVGGPVGTAHAIKLVNNLVALGYAAIWSECYAMVGKLGVAPSVLHEVVSNSGMNCGNFQNFSKYAVGGDPNAHRFTLANGYKDLSYYARLAQKLQTSSLMSDGALQTLKYGLAMGMGERYIPELVDVVVALNDPPGRDRG